MKHYDNLMKLMAMKPRDVRVDLYNAYSDGLVLFIGDQCISLFSDGYATYKRDYHNTRAETILCENINDLLDKVCFA